MQHSDYLPIVPPSRRPPKRPPTIADPFPPDCLIEAEHLLAINDLHHIAAAAVAWAGRGRRSRRALSNWAQVALDHIITDRNCLYIRRIFSNWTDDHMQCLEEAASGTRVAYCIIEDTAWRLGCGPACIIALRRVLARTRRPDSPSSGVRIIDGVFTE